jgi:hypothetical protein
MWVETVAVGKKQGMKERDSSIQVSIRAPWLKRLCCVLM